MTKTDLLCDILRRSGLLSLRERLVSKRRGQWLPILAYHRVLAELPGDFPFDRDVVSCTEREFAREMEFVARHFDPVSFADLTSGRADALSNPLIVTFDDGYTDNREVALPVLKRYGVKATFFVTTAYMDQTDLPWWDEIAYVVNRFEGDSLPLEEWMGGPVRLSQGAGREAAIRQLLQWAKRVPDEERRSMLAQMRQYALGELAELAGELMMSWDDCRGLAAEGMELGSHTVSHPVLSRMTDADAIAEELSASKMRIEAMAQCSVNAISYPVGSRSAISDGIVDAIRSAGYTYACLYENGVNPRVGFDPFRLLRIKTEVGDDFTRFRAKVLFPGVVRY